MSELFDSYSLIVETDETNALILAEALDGWNLGVHMPDGAGPATLEVFCATQAEAESRLRALRTLASPAHFDHATIKPVARQDWAESWKRFFHAQRVSERIIVKPSWEPFDALPDDCLVEIDPGLSFGTGLHGTTRACLRFLDDWRCRQTQDSILDLGCGTGILAIAAAKLGFARITAIDNDPNALRVARANALSNGVVDRIEYIQADVAEWITDRPYTFVMANLLAGILVKWVDRIVSVVSRIPGSGLVLSGILTEQYEAVRSAYVAHGFEEREALVLDGWKTGCFWRR